MKKIILKFLTKTGEQAYHKVEKAGAQESKTNRRVMRAIARDSITCQDPLTVEIKIKIPRLAIHSDMVNQIITGLAKFDAVKDKDYTMDVQY